MAQQKALAANLPADGLPIRGDAQLLLEIAEHPHVVIAGEEIDGDSPVAQLAELAQQPHEAFGNHLGIFEPVVEHVAQQIQRLGLRCDVVEPAQDAAFALAAVVQAVGAQVKVGCKTGVLHKDRMHNVRFGNF